MITYANDRKLAEYPFFDVGQTPFPAGCIKYLGICLNEETASRPVYASAITISMDGILVSICRETANANEGETLGSVYATAADGSISMELSAVSAIRTPDPRPNASKFLLTISKQ